MAVGDFSEQASWYHRSRPSYPDEAVDALLRDANVRPGDAVVDLGAGTGILTRRLVELGLQTTALEPNAKMREQAPPLPGVDWIDGTFEDTRLPTSAFRWAVAAQSFHWADPERSLPELRRILAPDGVFSVLWNNRDVGASDVLTWAEQAIGRHVPEFSEAYRDRTWPEILESTGDFNCIAERVHRHSIAMDRRRFLNLWKSHNRLNAIAGPHRFETFLDELEDYLNDRRLEMIDVPYCCESWSARRAGA